jgi:hypothetical protein
VIDPEKLEEVTIMSEMLRTLHTLRSMENHLKRSLFKIRLLKLLRKKSLKKRS